MITVAELIKALQRIENHNMPVFVTEEAFFGQQRHYKAVNRVCIEVDGLKGARILIEGHAPHIYELMDQPSLSKSHEHHEIIFHKIA